ncbi:MAG: DUF389 domain-containing protein [Flavobacteriaceae bacterium]
MDDFQDGQHQKNSKEEEQSREEIKKEFKGLLASARSFMSEMLDIRQNTDIDATKQAIIEDISFKGHTIWILVCSIFIASVGLNANSPAVVIGAMLISPLMGPILGIGLSIATNDIDTLKRSLLNGAIMVVYSILTAFLFFEFFPIINESSELLSRTAPDIRDVLIAFFGGLALVVARAKRGTVATVIFGVAIATALMPPLCTVGFGIAIRNWEYATGAMYLFTINAIFIALATFLVLKFLKIPYVKYIKSTRRRMLGHMASLVALLVMIPAGITFYNVFQESRFKRQAQDFLSETIEVYQFEGNGYYLDNLTQIDYKRDGRSTIELVCVGDSGIPDNIIDTWEVQMAKYSKMQDVNLRIVQGGRSDAQERFNYVNELYEAKKAELATKDERILLLEEEVASLSRRVTGQIPFRNISAEARANYENLETLAFSYTLRTNFQKIDTIPVFEVQWKKGVRRKQKQADMKKLSDWLKLRLRNNKIQIRELN